MSFCPKVDQKNRRKKLLLQRREYLRPKCLCMHLPPSNFVSDTINLPRFAAFSAVCFEFETGGK